MGGACVPGATAALRARSLRRRNANFSAKDVETLPARPRHPPQALEGGTSLVTSTAYRTTRTWDEAMLSLPNSPRHKFGLIEPVSPPRRRPAFQGLRTVSWTGLGTSLHLRPAFFWRARS